MSRLIDKLTRLRQTEPQPMGFMTGRTSSQKLKMQLIAYLTGGTTDKLSAGLDAADGVIIEVAKSDDLEALEKVCQAKKEIPGGARLTASNSGTLEKALNAACDFVVFPASIPLNIVQKDKIGRIMELDDSLSEGLLRTANDLPIDAVLISGAEKENNLTFNRLMLFQRFVNMVNKPILVSISDSLSEVDLQAICDTGVSGVVIELAEEKSLDKFAEMRKTIEKLAPPASRKKERMRPILPRLQPEPEKPEEGEEEEEDE
jgi:hypothetical protein